MKDVTTVADIDAWRKKYPKGSTMVVPKEIPTDLMNERKRRIEYVTAKVLETHKHVVVTSAGTYRWIDLFFL